MSDSFAIASRWVCEIRDPIAETMLQIRDGLEKMNPAAVEVDRPQTDGSKPSEINSRFDRCKPGHPIRIG